MVIPTVFITLLLHAQHSLYLHVGGMAKKKGVLYVAVYNTAADYMHLTKTFSEKIVSVASLQDTVIDLGSIPDGDYAFVMFLDENGNGRLDKNFLGIPSEKYGFSGAKQPLFRAPHFDEASIRVGGGHRTIFVSLH